MVRTKNKNEHQLRNTTVLLSPFERRIAMLISSESGKNANNQATISHGIQVLIEREAKRRGCKINGLQLRTTECV